jgi:tRNA A-37 threonylcarbamoyl transferase component Bud32
MTTQHPSRGELEQFTSGLLDDVAMQDIVLHIARCEACRTALRTIPPGGLETLVREALHCTQEPEADEGAGDPVGDVPAALQGHPRYRILGKIGAGGMGAVYRAQHRLMRREVALKVINPRLLTRPGAVARFRREVEAVAKLSHPNIATAFDAEQMGDELVLVTELVEGCDLAQVVKDQGVLPVKQAIECIRQAAIALQHAHERGIIHRDIKPSNLMLTPGNVVKVLDFGLAALGEEEPNGNTSVDTQVELSALGGSITDYGQSFGTPDFVAPEQRQDAHAVDDRADIFSLGCTFRFLLTGDANGDVRQRRDIPDRLVSVIDRMTVRNPDERFQRVAQVADALLPFTRSRMGRRWRWVAILAGLLMVATFGVVLIERGKNPRGGSAEMPQTYLCFTRTTDTVTFPRRIDLDEACTIEARLMLTRDGAGDWSVFNQWEHDKEDICLGVSPGGINGCITPTCNVDARCRVTLSQWHHVAFVWDGRQARLYLDGNVVGVAAAKGKPGRGDGVPTIGAIWRPPETPRRNFIGNLHWLRVSNNARYRDGPFDPGAGEPSEDANTLLLYPGGKSAQEARPGVGFAGATGPEKTTSDR